MTTSIQQCVICLHELDRDLSAAPCGHVFHNVCIDRWLSHGSRCPICHEELPRQQLLRLFFEPKQELAQAPLASSSGSVLDGTESPSGYGIEEYRQLRASSDPQVTRLRRELAKLNSKNREESARLERELGDTHIELIETKVTHKLVKEGLEGELKSATATINATKVDMSRVEEENRRLRRELGEARKLLCHPQREKVAFDFVQDIPSNITYSRPRNGLGQVDAEGFASPETAIEGQWEQLPRAIEREWRTPRELVSRDPLRPRQSMTDNEERDIGFQELQAKPTGSRAEYQYLSEAPSGRWRDGSYGNSPLMGSVRDGARIMGCSRDWQVRDSFFPQRLVGESHHGNHRGIKRPAPADLGSDFTDPARVTWRGFPAAKPRASTVEGDNGMIPLGSDEENGNEVGKGWPEFEECRDERNMRGIALDWPNGAADARCTGDVSSQFPLPGSRRGLD